MTTVSRALARTVLGWRPWPLKKQRAADAAPPRPEPHVVDLPRWGRTVVALTVDCIGAMCPRPQLLVMKVMGKLAEGEVVEVRCDSAPAVETFPALAQTLGATHLATLREADGWRVFLRRGVIDG